MNESIRLGTDVTTDIPDVQTGRSEPGGPGDWPPPSWPPRQPPPPRPPQGRWALAVAMVAAVVAIALIAYGAAYVFTPRANVALPTGAVGTSAATSSVTAAVDPAVVDINTTLGYQNAKAAGTGIVLTPTGEILTNHHVVAGATSISVTDVGNGRTYSGTVVGYDATDDIAVVQLAKASGLKTAKIGNSSSLSVGQTVTAIGNAAGVGGTPTASTGAVTALNRSIVASDPDGTSEQLTGLIQTSARLLSGDSGGPLVNNSAQVIGVDTAGSSRFSFRSPTGGQGFAIPINKATSIASQITAGRSSSTVHIGPSAFLGVEVRPSQSSPGSSSGAAIAGTVPGSPAANTGLSAGDVITGVGGATVTSPTDLSMILRQHHPGDRVSVTWTDQSGASHTATVPLANGPVS